MKRAFLMSMIASATATVGCNEELKVQVVAETAKARAAAEAGAAVVDELTRGQVLSATHRTFPAREWLRLPDGKTGARWAQAADLVTLPARSKGAWAKAPEVSLALFEAGAAKRTLKLGESVEVAEVRGAKGEWFVVENGALVGVAAGDALTDAPVQADAYLAAARAAAAESLFGGAAEVVAAGLKEYPGDAALQKLRTALADGAPRPDMVAAAPIEAAVVGDAWIATSVAELKTDQSPAASVVGLLPRHHPVRVLRIAKDLAKIEVQRSLRVILRAKERVPVPAFETGGERAAGWVALAALDGVNPTPVAITDAIAAAVKAKDHARALAVGARLVERGALNVRAQGLLVGAAIDAGRVSLIPTLREAEKARVHAPGAGEGGVKIESVALVAGCTGGYRFESADALDYYDAVVDSLEPEEGACARPLELTTPCEPATPECGDDPECNDAALLSTWEREVRSVWVDEEFEPYEVFVEAFKEAYELPGGVAMRVVIGKGSRTPVTLFTRALDEQSAARGPVTTYELPISSVFDGPLELWVVNIDAVGTLAAVVAGDDRRLQHAVELLREPVDVSAPPEADLSWDFQPEPPGCDPG